MQVCLVSTYDMGRQPFGLASPAAWLRRAGVDVVTLDLSREGFAKPVIEQSDWVAFHLPMHTATRRAVPCIEAVRSWNPRAGLICYGLYAPVNAEIFDRLESMPSSGASSKALWSIRFWGESTTLPSVLDRLAFLNLTGLRSLLWIVMRVCG